MSGLKYLAIGLAAVATGGIALAAAPAIAAALGGAGILGAAGTGAVIAELSGCALTAASLAAIGGSMAGGAALITGLSAASAGLVTAACIAYESGNIKEVRTSLCKMARQNRSEFESVYKKNKNAMSPAMRKLWEEHF